MREIEPFVDADRAAEFICMRRRRLLELARVQELPGHPVGRGKRHTWRFRLSELADAMDKKVAASSASNGKMPLGGFPAVPKRR